MNFANRWASLMMSVVEVQRHVATPPISLWVEDRQELNHAHHFEGMSLAISLASSKRPIQRVLRSAAFTNPQQMGQHLRGKRPATFPRQPH